jgi:hypothetical protein
MSRLATGTSTSVLHVAEVVALELGVDAEPDLRHQFRAGDIRNCYGDISLARELLAYEPRMRFDDGMHEPADWLRGQDTVDRVDLASGALLQRGWRAEAWSKSSRSLDGVERRRGGLVLPTIVNCSRIHAYVAASLVSSVGAALPAEPLEDQRVVAVPTSDDRSQTGRRRDSTGYPSAT